MQFRYFFEKQIKNIIKDNFQKAWKNPHSEETKNLNKKYRSILGDKNKISEKTFEIASTTFGFNNSFLIKIL